MASSKNTKKNVRRKGTRAVLNGKPVIADGKGKEVDHVDNNAKNNNRSNLKCISRKANRQKGAKKTNSKR